MTKMHTSDLRLSYLVFGLALFFVAGLSFGQTGSVFTTGLLHPNKVILAPANSLLVAEDGTSEINTGRISVVDRTTGNRHTLIAGFPSAPNPLGENQPDGVTGLHLQGNILWVTIGNGDGALPGPGPGLEVPNPNPSSDLFSSILEIRLPGGYTGWASPIILTDDDRDDLAANGNVKVQNADGNSVSIRVVANLPDHTPAPTPTSPENVKASHLYGLDKFQNELYVVDSGLNRIHRVSIATGSVSTLTFFPNRPNPNFPTPGPGGPFIEAVPDNIHRFGNRLLVPLLTGFPFLPGVAEIRAVDIKTGEHVGLIPNLTSAIDIIKADDSDDTLSTFAPGDGNAFYTLEFSTGLLSGAPGRLRYYSSPTATPEDVLTNLITPTSMVRDGSTGELFITNIGPGTLTRVTWAVPSSLIPLEKRSKF